MESDGGGVTTAAAITHWRLISQPSTLGDFFLTNDLSDSLKDTNNNPKKPTSRITLGAVLYSDQKPPPSSTTFFRTLLEAINKEALKHRSSKKHSKLLKKQNRPHFSCRNQKHNLHTKSSARSLLGSKSSLTSRSRVLIFVSEDQSVTMKSSLKSSSLRGLDTVPADDLALREVSSGGSPRSGGSFRLSAAVAAEREETRRRLSRELIEGSMSGRKETMVVDEEYNEEEDEEEEPDSAGGSGAPMRMSLMDLLEETDRQAGISGPTYRLDEEDIDFEEDDEDDEDEADEAKGEEYSCCVCNVKHRASAFKYCGHTFCRLCSRELDVQKGYCPTCNGFILEVLDIF